MPMHRYAIETNGLSRLFGNRAAVDQLSVQISAGSVFGFLGPNGAGKTTTVRMLAGLIAPTSGTAVVAGYRVGGQSDAIRRVVGLLTETPGLYDRLTARQNLSFFGRLYGLNRADAERQTDRYLRMLGLWERRDEQSGGFSKGMRQKLAIARALLHEPQIVFLDEPTAGLDPEAARIVREFVQTLRADGRTVFLTTHNLPEADELCDQIAVFRTRLLEVGAPADLRARLFGRGTIIRLVEDAAGWVALVRALPFVTHASADGVSLVVQLDDPDLRNPALVRALVESGASIRSVEAIIPTLERVYLELVGAKEMPL